MAEYSIQTPRQLSSHLRSLRKRLKLTQAQLGRRMGVEQARVAKIERNPGSISMEQLLHLLTVLESELFLRPKPAPGKAASSQKVIW
jgi:HTH-type transcriptional regulator/antitoxin HipB